MTGDQHEGASVMLKTPTRTLKDSRIFSTFAVRDTDLAKRFYGESLGLDVRDGEMPGLFEIHQGDQAVVVYPKPDHKPAEFTVLNFVVDDVERTVDELTSSGVKFERYDLDQMKTDAKGIVRGQGPDIAWFKDPFGNILSIIGRDDTTNRA
jgi:catechol 2,3-dioxygenase-like lactoylglutathione lyase family enzyme